jgi:hypothetical protein
MHALTKLADLAAHLCDSDYQRARAALLAEHREHTAHWQLRLLQATEPLLERCAAVLRRDSLRLGR